MDELVMCGGESLLNPPIIEPLKVALAAMHAAAPKGRPCCGSVTGGVSLRTPPMPALPHSSEAALFRMQALS